MKGLGLRQRLLLSLSLVLAGSFLVFGLAEYYTLRTSLLQEIDRNLESTARSLARQLPSGAWELGLEQLVSASDPLAGVYLEVISGDQRVVYASPNLQRARLPRPSRPGSWETVSVPDGLKVRLYSLEVQTPPGMVLVGQSFRDSPLAAAGKILLVGAVTLGLSLLVTSVVLSRGLAPLQRVAQTARYIVRTGDVSQQRVPVPPGNDDVVEVAVAFNSLVGRVDQLLQTQLRLLGDTSHELRNPLTVIMTDIDMLAQDLDQATRLEVTTEASQEVARLIRLVEHLLMISWAEAQPKLAQETVRLDTMVARLAARQATLVKEHRLELNIPDRPVWVSGDPDRIAQIFLNLLDNAVRHTPRQTCIRVRLESDARQVRLEVSDNGPGIASPHLEHIFERFYRVDPSRSRGSGGAGLGLPLAQALARLHGGELIASSPPGGGCCFRLELPLCEPPDQT